MSEVISTMEKGTVEQNRRFSQVYIFTLDLFTELQNVYPDTNMASPLCVCVCNRDIKTELHFFCLLLITTTVSCGFRPEEFGQGSAR